MKVMYVDYSVEGHHLEYLKYLSKSNSYESIAVLPQQVENLQIKQIVCSKLDLKKKKLLDYLKYMKQLKRIAEDEHVDVIHFLDGDSAMRYFDIGYRYLQKFHTVVTFHHLFPGKLREISVKRILNSVSMAVVHTDEIKETFYSYGCENVVCIHYPCFLPLKCNEKEKKESKTLLALGGTRYDKGLDLLLDALNMISEEFQLIIAGKEEFFTRAFIEKAIEPYKNKVLLNLKFLSSKEVEDYLEDADIIVLPYRKQFDGASGPMCEGAFLGKQIIGPNHGSLGAAIRKNHIGVTFESENTKDLARCIEQSLREEFFYDEIAKEYQKSLNPEEFFRKHESLYHSL